MLSLTAGLRAFLCLDRAGVARVCGVLAVCRYGLGPGRAVTDEKGEENEKDGMRGKRKEGRMAEKGEAGGKERCRRQKTVINSRGDEGSASSQCQCQYDVYVSVIERKGEWRKGTRQKCRVIVTWKTGMEATGSRDERRKMEEEAQCTHSTPTYTLEIFSLPKSAEISRDP